MLCFMAGIDFPQSIRFYDDTATEMCILKGGEHTITFYGAVVSTAVPMRLRLRNCLLDIFFFRV